MPYIVTTKRPSDCSCAMSEASLIGCEVHGYDAPDPDLPRESRVAVAVATLEEAKTRATGIVESQHGLDENTRTSLRASISFWDDDGLRRVTLPDGTVIEVERVGWAVLLVALTAEDNQALRDIEDESALQRDILDAFNAKKART